MTTLTPNPFSPELLAAPGPLHAVLEASPVAIVAVDRHGRIRLANAAAARLVGRAPGQLIDLPFETLVPVRLRAVIATSLGDFFAQRPDTSSGLPRELHLVRQDGGECPVEIVLSPLQLGPDAFAVAAITDISARVQAAREREERSRRLRTQSRAVMLLATDPAAASGQLDLPLRQLTELGAATLEVDRTSVWLFDETGLTLRCSDLYLSASAAHAADATLARPLHPGYFAALESEKTIAIGDTRTDTRAVELAESYFFPQGIRAALDAPIRLRGHAVGVVCFEQSSASRRWTDDEEVFAGIVADQAAQLLLQAGHAKAEEAAQEANQRHREIFDHAMEAIFSIHVSSEGEFVYETYNPAATRLTGVSDVHVRGKRPDDLFAPDVAAQLNANYRRCLEAGHPIEYIEDVAFPPGPRIYHTILTPIRDDRGAVFRIVGLARDVTEQKEAERKLTENERLLRLSEEKFSKAFRCSPDSISVSVVATGEIIDVNEGFEHLFGHKRADAVGRSSLELNLWASLDERARLVEMLGRDGAIHDFRATARTADGRTRECSLSGEVVEIGGKACLVLVNRDITIQLAAERALRASEEKFSKAFRSSPDAISLSDFETGEYIDINEGHEHLFGFPRAEVIGRSPQELGIHHDAAEVAHTRDLLLRDGTFRDLEIQTQNRRGDAITLLMSGELIELAGKTHMLRVSRDVTDRKRAERALRESEARFRSYFESPLIGMAITAPDRRWLEVNDHMCRMLGYTREELLKLHWSDLTPEDDLRANDHLLRRALAGDVDTYSMEKRYRRKDGGVIHTNISVRAIRRAGGAVDYFLTVVQDITPRIEAERARGELESQLRQAQKLEALGQLAGGIAHDFNNILTAIMAYSELAEMDADAPDEVRKHLAQVQAASHRAKDLVRRILAFSRQRKQERKALQLQPVVQEALKLLRSTLPSTVEIDARIDEDAPVALADPVQVHQVLMNLCTNAAHAMRERPGRLAVRLEAVAVDAAAARAQADLLPGRYSLLTVSDNGQGMSAEVLKRIFEPFFTTKGPGEGTGLGLAVVHGIMKDHEGAIGVESKPGEGTVFRLYFPEHTATVENVEASRTDLPRGNAERILFVDDEPALCDSAQQIFSRLGYRVAVFSDPLAAVQRFRRDPDAFDLVITDLTMPRMTGVDVAREIIGVRPSLPVLLASGFSGTWTLERVRALGIRDLISKPLTAAALAQAVRRTLDETAPPPPHASR